MKTKTTTRRPQAKTRVARNEPTETDVIDLTLEEDDTELPSSNGTHLGDILNTDSMARMVSASRHIHRNSGHVLDPTTHEPGSRSSASSLDADDEEDLNPELESILRDILPQSLAAFAASTLNHTPPSTTMLRDNHTITSLHHQNFNESHPTRQLSNQLHQHTPSSTSAVRCHGGSEPLTPEKWVELKEALKRKGREQIRFWEAVLKMLD